MSFKRARSLHYGIHKSQSIVQNGVSQLSPLDRKQLPLDQQKQISLTLSSDDRDGAPSPDSLIDPTSSTDCVINFVDAVKGVYAYRVLSFSFINGFYSVQTGLNDSLTVLWTITPVTVGTSSDVKLGKIKIPQGYYSFFLEPEAWFNPIDPDSDDTNLNFIENTNKTNLLAYYPTDIRVALLIAAEDTITSITTDRKTKTIKISWVSGLAPTVVVASSSYDRTTVFELLGLSRQSSGGVWTGIAPVHASGPVSIALQSDVLNNSEVIDPDGPTEFFLHVPVEVPQGARQIYLPPIPPLVTFNSQSALVRIPFKIVDHATQQVLNGAGVQWQMILSVYSTDSTPAK